MRVLHVSARAGFFGGVERILFDMAARMGARGHAQGLLYVDGPGEAPFLSAFSEHAGGLQSADDLVDRFKPDVILIHKPERQDLIAHLAARIPTVRMVHDHDLVCLRRHKYFPVGTRICSKPAGAACYRHLCFIQRAPAGSRLPIRFVRVSERRQALRAHRQVRRFIVGSHWMAQSLTMNGIDTAQIDVLPPVPAALSDTRPYPASETPEVLFVGQVIRGKGVDLLLRALTRVRTDWHATIVGTGNHLDACRSLASRLGLGERVTFAGWVDHEYLEAYYAKAAVAAVPSRWPEPFGMVGIEAMARGRPVVGFAAGGIGDWLHHERNGLIAPPADWRTFGDHLQRLLANQDTAVALGAQAAADVRERYRPEQFIADTLATLDRAIGQMASTPQPGTAPP